MTRTSIVKWMGLFILLGLVVGCASMKLTPESADATTPAQAEPSKTEKSKPAESKSEKPQIVGKIPRGSPFSKIAIGMPQKQVYDLIGPPTETQSYKTGKALIPFYYGSDLSRTEAHYKGQGRIVFTRNRYSGISTVYRIEHDPTEDGYAK